MGNSPSITGLDRGGAHGRRDIVKDVSRAEQRPARFQADESDSELAGSQPDMESNRKSRVDNAPEPSIGYNIFSWVGDPDIFLMIGGIMRSRD